jgi:exopolysaccharide biosynthesis WecB/TagA/CpsF family protein
MTDGFKTISGDSIPISAKRESNTKSDNKTYFFGVRFDNITKEAALNTVHNFLTGGSGKKSRTIFFTNVHTIFLAGKDPAFTHTINNADLVLPDGSGLNFAGKIFSKKVKENLNGTDFTPLILQKAEQLGSSVYLLGATLEVVTECMYRLTRIYPGLDIKGFRSGYYPRKDEGKVIGEIAKISPDILLIAMGSPKQEILAEKIRKRLNNTLCIAVGGLFDFIAGEKTRAPLLLRETGMEWLFRFIQDPKSKWERILIETPFFALSLITARFITNSIYSSADRRPCLA